MPDRSAGPGRSEPGDGRSLGDRLYEVATPLSEAFVARYRAIGAGDPLNMPPAELLSTLLRCVAAGDDVEAIVKLSAATATSHAHAPALVEAYRNAIQALDWAIRDMQLEQYTAVERERFATSTALFTELVRRATGEAHGKRGDHPDTIT